MPTHRLSATSSASSGLPELDRLWDLWDSSISQLQLASTDSSAGSLQQSHPSEPCPPRKRRRLLTAAGSRSSILSTSSSASDSGSDGTLDGEAEDEDDVSLADGLDIAFSASLSLPSRSPLAGQSSQRQDEVDLSLISEALLPGETSSDGDAGGSSSGDEADDGLSDSFRDAADWDAAFSSLETTEQTASESQLLHVARAERRALATAYIEDLLLSTLHQVVARICGRRSKPSSESQDEDAVASQLSSSDAILLSYGPAGRHLLWPQRRGKGANSKVLSRIWQLLALIHQGLRQGTTSTKRELFYADPGLFGSQSNVDRIVERIVAPSGLRRGDFGVIASPKGLFASTVINIRLADDEGTVSSRGLPTLIPPIETISEIVMTIAGDAGGPDSENDDEARLHLILVIEKDATFQALCEQGWGSGQAVLVTGKGFPDLSTRHFTALLSQKFPHAPIYGLFDGDPDGIEILSCYKFGSRSRLQIRSAEENELPIERMQWLGVKPSEWGRMNIDWDLTLPLTQRDHEKITSMLDRPPEQLPKEWKKELCHMQHLRRKAEIQLLQSAAEAPPGIEAGSLFDLDAPATGASLGGVNRLVAYLDAKTGLVSGHE